MASTAMVSIEGQGIGNGGRLFFGDFDHFAALVFAAMRTHAMRDLGFMAVGALGHDGGTQRIVGPAGRGAALGMSSFWIGHGLSLPSFQAPVLFQGCPAVVQWNRLASAVFLIPILAARRA